MKQLRAIGVLTSTTGLGLITLFIVLFWRLHDRASRLVPRFELHDSPHGRGEVLDSGGIAHQVADAKLWFLLGAGVAVLVVGMLVLSMTRKTPAQSA